MTLKIKLLFEKLNRKEGGLFEIWTFERVKKLEIVA
jgi:hypothetical protein